MKNLKDFQQDLNKCSKCGLCQQACPLYKLNPNECVVSKGKFIMLHGVTKGELQLSNNINKYLDMCLRCGKCNAFCPSGIDVCKIINTAKYEYMKNSLLGNFINFLESRQIFGLLIKLGSVFSCPFRPKREKVSNPSLKVVYFKGCVNQICPRTDNYIQKIFQNTSVEFIEPDFECCGLPFLSEGNLNRFVQAAKSNLEKLNCEYDYIVADCASCAYTLKEYPKYVDVDKDLNNIHSIGDLIALTGVKFRFKKPVKVTFHKPCHLENDSFFKRILANCENVEYVEMEDYDECCGFAGSFAIKNSKLSIELSKKKAKNIINTGADYVITTCPACLLGLKQGLILSGGKTKVISLLEFLAKGC